MVDNTIKEWYDENTERYYAQIDMSNGDMARVSTKHKHKLTKKIAMAVISLQKDVD